MDKYIGYITTESNINTIRFYITQDNINLGEGDIIKTKIENQDTLFQVINGNTKEEVLEGQNKHGFTVGIGRKLGTYNRLKKELEVVKWVPEMFEPVYRVNGVIDIDLGLIAQNSIGRLPNTDFSIPINDFNSLVTHNTAILGILGIGKSCLSFELIKKITSQNIKVEFFWFLKKHIHWYLNGTQQQIQVIVLLQMEQLKLFYKDANLGLVVWLLHKELQMLVRVY